MALSTAVSPTETATTPTRMTGGDALAEMLIRNGVDTIFGLPGVQLDGSSTRSGAHTIDFASSTPATSRRPPTWPTATPA